MLQNINILWNVKKRVPEFDDDTEQDEEALMHDLESYGVEDEVPKENSG